jgi:hypothetical protein
MILAIDDWAQDWAEQERVGWNAMYGICKVGGLKSADIPVPSTRRAFMEMRNEMVHSTYIMNGGPTLISQLHLESCGNI